MLVEQTNASEMRVQVAKLGLAAVLAYGLFDGVTYTSFFVLAFLGYEKSTGQNPAANLKALLGVSTLLCQIFRFPWLIVNDRILYAVLCALGGHVQFSCMTNMGIPL